MKILERLQLNNVHFDGASEFGKTTFSSVPYIAAGLLAAVVCSLYLKLFLYSQSVAARIFHEHEWQLFVICPVVFMISTWIVRRFAPGNGGGGIPQVMAAMMADDIKKLNSAESDIDSELVSNRYLNWRVLPVKILSCCIGSLGGGGIGPEGPCVQLSAVVFRMTRDFWKRVFGTELSFYNMIVAGGAGGIAAAFNTPLGGIMFGIEHMAKSHVATIRLGTIEAVIACGFFSQLLNGPYLYLGFPVMSSANSRDFLLIVAISFIGGVAGALFGVFLRKIICWRRTLAPKSLYAWTALSGVATAMLIFIVGGTALGSGHELMKEILFKDAHPTVFQATLTGIARFVSPLFVACSEVAAGIFAPSLAAGAAIGQLFSQLFNPSIAHLSAICGMIAFLTGITRTPLTAFVIMMEMTDRHTAIFAMMISAIIAFISARAIEKESFYDLMAEVYLSNMVKISSSRRPSPD